jgi:hypothetical protein
MKDYFKYGVLLVITLTIAYVCITLRDCGEGGQTSAVVVTPPDSGFVPILKKTYKPASLPAVAGMTFEKQSKPDVKLPRNVSESNVSRIIVLHPKEQMVLRVDSSTRRSVGSLTLIETKDGGIYIDTAQVKKVEMIAYEEPILRFGSFISLGVTLQPNLHLTLAVAFSPLQICGIVQFPLLALDTEGAGAGVAARMREISFGLLYHQPFVGDRQLKLSFTYNL